MLFAEMLKMQVKPQKKRTPEHLLENMKKGPKACTMNALVRYKAVMEGEWLPTNTIESRLGYARWCSITFLRKLEAKGVVAKRPRDNAEVFNKRCGWEWTWIYEGDLNAIA